MSLKLVHNADEPGSVKEAVVTLAEVLAVMDELRCFVAECRDNPSSMEQLKAADLARAKVLLAEARAKLTHARRSIAQSSF
jgi:hypothetical protein